MEVQVEYDYSAQEDDEMSIQKGDILTNVVQKLDGWWEGTLGDKRGLFPDNFCRIISNGSDRGQQSDDDVFNEVVELRNKKSSARKLKALFSYSPEQDDELALEVGDVLEFISDVEDGWMVGLKNGKRGIFPSNFVTDFAASEISNNNGPSQEPIKSHLTPTTTNQSNRATYIKEPAPEKYNSIAEDEPPPLPRKPERERCRCIYPYTAQNEDELDLNEGDIITIITKNCEDEGWWRGEHTMNGRGGLFPDNFCKILSPNGPLTTSSSTFPQQKLLAQGRNITGLFGAGDSSVDYMTKDFSGDNTDGATGSKLTDSKKNVPIKRDSKENLPAPVLGVSQANNKSKSPPSPITAINPVFGLPPSSKSDRGKDEEIKGDFNAIERNEKLSHLTVGRAKTPKRRPPSTLLSREEHGIANGVDASLESSIDSPQNFNTSMNHNGTSSLNTSSNSTPSTVFVSDTSNLSTPGQIRPLQNHYRETGENHSTQSPTTLNSTEIGSGTPTTGSSLPTKPKKLLPWMAELQQKQDKKRELAKSPNSAPEISPISSSPSSGVANKLTGGGSSITSNSPMSSTTPTPTFTSTPSLRPTPSIKEKDPVPSSKPPPLPAKPTDKNSTSANSPIVPVATTTITTTSTTPSSTISTFSLKFGGVRKSNSTSTNASSPSHTSNNYTNTALNPITTPPHVTNNSTPTATTTTTTTNNSISNKNGTTTPVQNTSDAYQNASGSKGNVMKPEFVPYEEFERLKERVNFLENELEATRKQLKLILQTTDKGHIV